MITPQEYEAMRTDPQYLVKKHRAMCERGDHVPMKAKLDESVSCIRCGADLGQSQ
ncbi:hypothetical protein [Roseovarius indicus]|uniref:Uncharacterized protein n=1 Tax=Roseovarius indicus TaxID=540747 RepID=A0A5P3AGI1_9RHOB|nr:hypothetical protein [Roseovarius indicus]QEW27813.1 hypothetical protein RIdsm_03633 [Roseovarius indicus]SFE80059.1 hypothetical protein SAMN04488031_12255 [Roseovarius indicus]